MRGLQWRVVQAVLVAAVGCVAGELAAQQRAAVPDVETQRAVKQAAADIYGKRFREARSSAAKTALAKEILDAAAKVPAGSTDQYVLLVIARDIAAGAGDATTALEAAERLAASFDVPGATTKAETLATAAREASSSAQHKAVAEASAGVIDELAAAEDYASAAKLCETAQACARRARQYALVKKLAARAERLADQQEALRTYREAMAVLEKRPGDPAANLAAGRYLCFERDDWARGVPMLALGSDAELKTRAANDLQGAKSPEDQAALGDTWWSLAETRQGPERESLMLRAGTWYRQAEPSLPAGLARVKIEKRLAELSKLGRAIPEPPGGPPPAIAPFDAKKAKAIQLRWSKHLKVPVIQTNSIGMKLVLIPPGEFGMGSTEEEVQQLLTQAKERNRPEWALHRIRGEAPKHRVKITRAFYLGACEVTVGQFRKFADATGYRTDAERDGKGGGGFDARRGRFEVTRADFTWRQVGFAQTDDHPVLNVTWNDACAFCRWLAEKDGHSYRLATEAEWEFACRAGTSTRYCFGDDEARLDEYAWFTENSRGTSHPVGVKRPNAWGLFDMHGNVFEWCKGFYSEDYYSKSPSDDPAGPDSAATRVVRGASLSCPRDYSRSAFRLSKAPDFRIYNLGFGVVRAFAP